MAKGN